VLQAAISVDDAINRRNARHLPTRTFRDYKDAGAEEGAMHEYDFPGPGS
jgi:hypothetical protein